MECGVIMFKEHRLEMGYRIIIAKDSPDAASAFRSTVVKLMCLHLCKLSYQLFVDDEVLLAIHAWRLILVCANPRLQEFCHPEMWIAQQSRQFNKGSQYLCIERPTAVAHQHIWLLAVYQLTDKSDGLLGMHRQVRRYHFRTTLESLAQSHRWHTLATGKESM